MTAAHTPGPWVWVGDKLVGKDGARVIDSAPYEGQWVNGDDEDLIASAPDLLKALKRIAAAEADHLDGARDSMVLERAIKVAKSAIAKATGQ